MVILITGASHTGKTLLARRLLKKHACPCLSIDLLKMGLIRSGNTALTPEDDRELEGYLWPIVREMIKTALENGQNLIVEGGYIPFSWKEDFDPQALSEIRFCCLVMSSSYLRRHFGDVKRYASVAERRGDDSWCTLEFLLEDNARCLRLCRQYHHPCLLIDDRYQVEPDWTAPQP